MIDFGLWSSVGLAILAIAFPVYLLFATRMKKELKLYGAISIPYVRIPTSGIWRRFKIGRTRTLKLPLVGVFIAVGPQDARTELTLFITLSHEEQHGIEIERDGYWWFWFYRISAYQRFRSELRAFAASVCARREVGLDKLRMEGREDLVCGTFFYAVSLSQDFNLGKDYPLTYCYEQLRQSVAMNWGEE